MDEQGSCAVPRLASRSSPPEEDGLCIDRGTIRNGTGPVERQQDGYREQGEGKEELEAKAA